MKTEEVILQKVFYLFLEKGFAETSTNEIIRKVNLTKGGFYYMFKSRDDLIQRVIERYLKPYYLAPIDAMAQKWANKKNATTEELLWNCFFEPQRFSEYQERIGEIISFRQFFFLQYEGMKKFPNVADYSKENMKARAEYLGLILERGRLRGEIAADADIGASALMILALQDGILAIKAMDEQIDEEEKFRTIEEKILKDIGARESKLVADGGVESAVS